jgi:serine/threonine protein kinase
MKINKYEVLEKIGQGQFGVVFRGFHEKKGEPVAVKCEPQNTPYKILKHETTILNMLYSKSASYIPPIYWYGKHEIWNVLVMPYYEMSLEQYVLKKLIPKQSPQHIVKYLYNTMLSILQHLHTHLVLHRDLKPQNFMVHQNTLILIDFGLATFSVDGDGKSYTHETPTQSHITGNIKYASYYTHQGYKICPIDEYFSVFYICIWMVYNILPWSSIQVGETSGVPPTHIEYPKNKRIGESKTMDVLLRFFGSISPIDVNTNGYWEKELGRICQHLYSLPHIMGCIPPDKIDTIFIQ